MRIVTEHVLPPIPDRRRDWMAYDSDTYDGPGSLIGTGPTKQAAINDLISQMWERFEETNTEFHSWCITEGLIPQRKNA